ncbi:acyltransferase family protein [Sphaerotilus microaerophilus]|uniref:Acyltransferase n=1 Tax=Sphaerotilus microaerophilus TaxID=2914710 RepID=A0ABM7YKG6_9BURK|nr:acyltransferase [Sphaerotilus sp. FB-5]BDI04932.1 acyltransferase [Sphaerotilus sp. FB-5]
MKKNDSLTGWRGFAILSVLVGHFLPGLGLESEGGGSVNAGRLGVELFFALSGYLIGGILFKENLPLDRFAVRRLSRILPSLLLFLLTVGVYYAYKGWLSFEHLLFVGVAANWYPTALDMGLPRPVGHLWSVYLELQGYLVLAGLAAIVRFWRGQALVVLSMAIAVSVAWVLLNVKFEADPFSLNYQKIFFRPDGRLVAMLSGALFGVLSLDKFHILTRAPVFPVVFCVSIGLQFGLFPDAIKYTLGSLFMGLSVALLAISCNNLLLRWFSLPIFVFLGETSYSIYIWQQLVYVNKGFLGTLASAAAAVAIGGVMHYLYDARAAKFIGSRLGRCVRPCAASAA